MDGWTVTTGVDITSGFRGVTTPVNELITEIESRGWAPTVKLKSGEGYIATAKGPFGDSVEGTGPDPATAMANVLVTVMRKEVIRGPAMARTAMWNQDWSSQLDAIAAAYAKAPVYDPKAAPAWKALADDSMRRAEVVKQQIQVEIVPDPEPYDTPQEMCQDVHQNKHFLVSSANCQHPVWTVEQNIAFRIVHDVLGHCVSGGDFGWAGENRACAAHFPLLPELAQKALFTECIGQTAAAAYFRSFMQQKVAFLDEFMEDAQAQENPPGHQGVHPSQSLAPTAMPQVKPSTPVGLPWTTQVPNEDFQGQLPVFGKVAGATRTQLLNQAQDVEQYHGLPDQSKVVHEFPDGWTIRQPTTYGDLNREGQLMGTCWSEDFRHDDGDRYGPWNIFPGDYSAPLGYHNTVTNTFHPDESHYSLRDPDNIPHVSYGGEYGDASGRHNSDMKPEYYQKMQQWRPHEFPDSGYVIGRMGAYSVAADPNSGWSSGIDPMPDNAYLWHGDPLQAQEGTDNAMKIDTGWHNFTNPVTKEPDRDSMRQAIVNAFRAVLLSPRKDLRWNAIHYQDISHIPATVTDPKRYWDALEERRVNWNTARGFHPDSHKPYFKELQEFKRYVAAANPDLNPWEAEERAQTEFMHMWNEEEERVNLDPKNADLDAGAVERKVAAAITKRLKGIVRPTSENTDYGHEQLFMTSSQDLPLEIRQRAEELLDVNPEAIGATEQLGPYFLESHTIGCRNAADTHPDDWWDEHFQIHDEYAADPNTQIVGDPSDGKFVTVTKARTGAQLDLEGQEAGKYGAFMGTHLKQISQLSQHVDEILDAAVEDVKAHDGTGHHFRSTVLSLHIPGVGPKVCSFAWLLLQPATSQLATIDTHMMDVLGHNYEKEMNDRDYFKFERELAAGRDASGYGHVPLGQYQWMMWDNKRTGPGSHQDHSSLKVVNPTPHDQVDWAQKIPVANQWQPEPWWEATQPARDQVARDWDQQVATQYSKDQIPRFASTNSARTLQREIRSGTNFQTIGKLVEAASQRVPYILWNDQVWVGQPGETFMNLARRQMQFSPEEVWAKMPEHEFSAGVYDPAEDHLFPQDIITRRQEIVIRQQIGVPHENAPSFFA